MSGVESQGTIISIGEGDATTVLPATDTFLAIGCVKSWDGPGGSASIIDATCLSSTAKEKLIGLRDEGSISLTMNRLFDNTGQNELKDARASRQLRNFKIEYQDADNTVGSFTGYVMEFSTSGGVDALVEASTAIEISGPYTEATA